MGFYDIFYYKSEMDSIDNLIQENQRIINERVESYFRNTNSLDNLLFKTAISEEKDLLLTNYESLIYSIQFFGKSFTSVSYSSVYTAEIHKNLTNPLFIMDSKINFYLTIFVLLFLLIAIFKRLKFLKIMLFVVLIPLASILAYNYFIFEPKLIENKKALLSDEYQSALYKQKLIHEGNKTFYKLYEPVKEERNYKKVYQYNVIGSDINGNFVNGKVTTYGDKFGDGEINVKGRNLKINVEWIGNGILKGIDDEGIEYSLEVD